MPNKTATTVAGFCVWFLGCRCVTRRRQTDCGGGVVVGVVAAAAAGEQRRQLGRGRAML
jgi:hypothetical protein